MPKKLVLSGVSNNGNILKYDLDLRGNVTVVKGDSGTGKTLLCKVAKQNIENYGDKRLAVIDSSNKNIINMESLRNLKGKIIFIDDADLIKQKELFNFIVTDTSNYYIVFKRDSTDIKVSPNYVAIMVKDNNGVRRLQYKFSVEGWY